jgi:hypothetical protein
VLLAVSQVTRALRRAPDEALVQKKEPPMPPVPLRSTILWLALLALAAAAPTAASAKSKGKSCASAEALFLETGAGDRDGDGLSDCREKRQLRTLMADADSDDDSVSDGEEIIEHSDPLDVDSDDDGLEDGEDETPGMPEQEIKAFLDALTCPVLPGGIGEITALGVTVPLNDLTVFEDTTCDAVLALHLAGTPPVFVEIDVLEDVNGALTAVEVEVEHDENDDDEDHDEDDDAEEGAID